MASHTARMELLNRVREARERCVVRHVPQYAELRVLNPAEKTEFLWGSCIENADVLAEYLRSNTPYEVSVVRGGLDIPKEPMPTNHEDALMVGTVHHWVRVKTLDGVFHCDVACEDEEFGYGGPMVVRELPTSYVRF